MNRSTRTVTKVIATALTVGTLGAFCLFAAPAVAQDEFPPPEVIATLTPVYHEGHAAYWWHDHWHYRGEHGWAHYREEPPYLRQHRTVVVYHRYGRR